MIEQNYWWTVNRSRQNKNETKKLSMISESKNSKSKMMDLPTYLLCCSGGFRFWFHWDHDLDELGRNAQLPLTVPWRDPQHQVGGRADQRSAGTGVTDGHSGSLSWCHLGAILIVPESNWLRAAVREVEVGGAWATIEHTGDHAEGRWEHLAPHRVPRGWNSD